MRAIAVKTRIMKYFCPDCSSCLDDIKSRDAESGGVDGDSCSLSSIYALLKPLYEKISSLETEVKNLKDTNVDLIKMFTKKPQLISNDNISSDKNEVNSRDNNEICYASKLKATTQYHANRAVRNDAPGINLNTSSKNSKSKEGPVTPSFSSDSGTKAANENFTRAVRSGQRHYQRRNVNIGCAQSISDSDGFAGRETSSKKAWLFVSRVKDDVTEETVKTYIINKTNLNQDDVIVKQIETTYNRKDSKCFQVGVKFEMKDVLYKGEFWPQGVAFRRFKFNFNKQNDSSNSNSSQGFL